jgi:uncharacterized surface protein with fasciclin (FAS1) repeats
MKNLFKKVTPLLLLAVFSFSCSSKDDDPVTPPPPPAAKSITAILGANPEYSQLVTALKDAKLDVTLDKAGSFTVFAPNNAAFDRFKQSLPLGAKIDLPNILLNHVLATKKNAKDLKTEYVSTEAKGIGSSKISLFVDLVTNKDKVTLNGKSKVTSADNEASNGVIHYVDEVISIPTIVDAAIANPNFKTLISVLTTTEQEATLGVLKAASATSPLTVLAPTNKAFEIVLDPQTGWAKDATPAQLTTVLQYHVAASNVRSSDLTNNKEITTVGGQKLIVIKSATSVKFQDQDKGTSEVLGSIVDVQCENGVIHGIAAVLKPAL